VILLTPHPNVFKRGIETQPRHVVLPAAVLSWEFAKRVKTGHSRARPA
jgi:hypothetical protein